jgi:hypothetical protein
VAPRGWYSEPYGTMAVKEMPLLGAPLNVVVFTWNSSGEVLQYPPTVQLPVCRQLALQVSAQVHHFQM